MRRFFFYAFVLFMMTIASHAEEISSPEPTSQRDILVTFDNSGARASSGGLGAPYRNRKRYSIANSVRRDAAAVARDLALTEIDHWPIRSLSVYCFVYRIPPDRDRDSVLKQLNADKRIESAQALQIFNTSSKVQTAYDDTYANLQYGLDMLDITLAHRLSRGTGIRIAIIDSNADAEHEDLRGRISKYENFERDKLSKHSAHGTAVAGIIGARANNALGIVGVAPEAELEIFASCWNDAEVSAAVCDSFTLLKALDVLLEDPPHILNMSLAGPWDPLLHRVLTKAIDAGVIVVAACPTENAPHEQFPASMERVIGVGRSDQSTAQEAGFSGNSHLALYAPGRRILVAAPNDAYNFRSGSSLSAAHVSGVVALLLGVSPQLSVDSVRNVLAETQIRGTATSVSVNACKALREVDPELGC